MEGKWAFQETYNIAQEQFYHPSKYHHACENVCNLIQLVDWSLCRKWMSNTFSLLKMFKI